MIKNLFKSSILIIFIVAVVLSVCFVMLKYNVEGEKNMPYSISKILAVSTVDGQANEDAENVWNIGVEQVNDIYIYLNKEVDKDITIKQIKIENFNLEQDSAKGTVQLLKPTGDLPNLYIYSNEDFFSEGLTYTGSSVDDLKSLEISNDGGVLGFRLALTDLGRFISNDIEEITYDGTLLSNLGVNIDELKFKVSFDIIITTSEKVNFKGTVTLDLPIDGIIENGTSSKEITDFSDVVFKRV